MPRGRTTVLALALLAPLSGAMIGCSDKPHEYGKERPPIDEIDGRDTGLQSKDVVNASDKMAEDLLGSPQLNNSKTQWVVVVDKVDMNAVDARGDLDVFLRRLKVNLAKLGNGRVTLIENRAKLQELQSRELDGPTQDPFGQGTANRPTRLQPDYSLYCRVSDLPNRGTNYYFFEFVITDLKTGVQPWQGQYEVRVAR